MNSSYRIERKSILWAAAALLALEAVGACSALAENYEYEYTNIKVRPRVVGRCDSAVNNYLGGTEQVLELPDGLKCRVTVSVKSELVHVRVFDEYPYYEDEILSSKQLKKTKVKLITQKVCDDDGWCQR